MPGRPQEEPKAYSYQRFSTPQQGRGDSLRRQTELARAWAVRHDVQLDTELDLTDPGISAYAGANMETGALGVFRDCARDGRVPRGSWLLVESLDRISRQAPRKAVRALEDIVETGITVVDLSDGGREYNAETLDRDHMMFLMMVVRFIRANEESATKGMRVAGAYENKRRKFASRDALDKPYTRRLPAWIKWDDAAKGYVLIPERARIVRKIFELTERGWGQHRIARWLNEAGVETWGAGGWKAKYWHRSYVRKILGNPAAVGTFVPHRVSKKTRTPLEAVHHRLPAAIDREQFGRVADRLSTAGARGRNAERGVKSIFAGVVKCQHCGGTVTRAAKGGHVYLVCAAAHASAGRCKYESVPYQDAEDALRRGIGQLIEEAPRGNDTTALQEEIAQQRLKVEALVEQERELLDIRISDKSSAARRQLQHAEAEREAAEKKLSELEAQLDRLTTTNVANRLRAVESAFEAETINVTETNRVLRQAMRKMVMRPAEGELLVYWHHAEEPQEVPFLTRRFKWDRKQIWETEAEGA